MKRITLIFCILLFSKIGFSQNKTFWTVGTAATLPQGTFQTGIFMPLRYGYKHDLEIWGHPLWFFVMPNANIKKRWYRSSEAEWIVSSNHGFSIPTLLLNKSNEKFPKYFETDTIKYPFLFTIKNELVITHLLDKGTTCSPPNYLLTVKLGLKYTVNGNDTTPTINQPMLYTESMMYRYGWLWYVGADLEVHSNTFWDYSVDINFEKAKDAFMLKHKALFVYPFRENFIFAGGYQFVFSPNPASNVGLYPIADIVYKFARKKKSDSRELFDRKMF